MIYIVLTLWVACIVLMLFEKRISGIIIYLAVFSLLSTVAYMFLGAPDVAMAEAAASVFTTVFFIICLEKYFGRPVKDNAATRRKTWYVMMPAIFTIAIVVLFLLVLPQGEDAIGLSQLYILRFSHDFIGDNPVTAIYLGYRVYDTLFEALMLVISVVAVIHVSKSEKIVVKDGKHSEMEHDGTAVFAIRLICPVMLLFGVYLMVNGHITPGGGFQGGLALATFFICRFFIYNVFDLPIKKLMRLEEAVFAGIIIFAVLIVFGNFAAYLPASVQPLVDVAYMVLLNVLIGLKVACAFIILFYRYMAVERA